MSDIAQAALPLDEGEVILQWPKKMSRASFEDFKDWIDLMIRKAERAVGESPSPRRGDFTQADTKHDDE